jgi:diguanylate cyclase (GGDEF)-like protein
VTTTTTNRRVLLIDDTPSIHEDFRKILSGTDATTDLDVAEEALFGSVDQSDAPAGFELDSAHQGAEGLAKLRAALDADRPYALAFVDMRMPPGWDGLETIQQLWKVDPRLQIVICTAHSDYSWDEVLARLGVEDRLLILKKPFDHIEVAQLASALSAKWDLTRQAELKVRRLEAASHETAKALEIANRELDALIIQVTHDDLTGLPNRVLFADRAAQALVAARRDHTRPVVLMMDLDRFKEVNDTLGHSQGDVLLQQIAERLRGLLRPHDTVARLAGDEFALLLTDGGPDAGTKIAMRIGVAIAAPFNLGDNTVAVEASIGIAVMAADEHSTLEELLRQADIAMYKAKADGSGFAHYSAGKTTSPGLGTT